jgi:hypothetical protein
MLRTSDVRGTVRTKPYGQARSRTDRRRRGTIYLLVVAVAANLVVIGLAAVALVRVRVRSVHLEAERREAQRLAYSGVEQAIAMMNNYTGGTGNWRADYTNDVETTPLDFGDGQVSFKLVDEDGDLADDPTDPVWIYGIGRAGDAIWIERAKARVDQGLPLECLRTAVHSYGQLTVGATLTVVGAPASTDGNLLLDGTINGDAEALSLSGSGSVLGVGTVPAEKKGMPLRSLFDEYVARATTLTHTGDFVDVVLGPGVNEYDGSGTNPDGVYYINTGGSDLRLETMRLLGTLIVDLGSGTLYVQGASMDPYREDFPVLIAKGSVYQNTAGVALDESNEHHNYNPPGAPYQGETDSDTSDSYSSGVRGLIHIIGYAEFDQVGLQRGAIVVDGQAEISAATTLTHDPDLMYNPPLGYANDPNSTAMVIRSGSWSRQPAP